MTLMTRTTETPRLRYYFNATIHTMDPARPVAGHMLVAGDRILSCNDDESPLGIHHARPGFGDTRRRLADSVTFHDLQGATVIPGMTDSHVHFLWWALNMTLADLGIARSEAHAVEVLRKHCGAVAAGKWIVGFGWAHNLWEDPRLPSRASLDAAFPDNPVFLSSKCGHLAWVNSAALAAAGLGDDSPDPQGGELERRADGTGRQLTGILKENATSLVESRITKPGREDLLRALKAGQERAHSLGLTSVHTPEPLDTWDFLQTAHGEGLLTMRVQFLIPVAALEHLEGLRARHGLGDPMLRIAGVKMFTDGSLGGRTAWMYEPYEGEPGNTGICVAGPDEIRETTLRANRAGLPMAIHAIGDRSVGDVLRAFDAAREELGASGAAGTSPAVANRIEHLQSYSPRDLDLIRRVRPVASMQPVHLCADMGPADRFWGDRARHAYACRTLSDAGCLMSFGSDAPVEPIEPFFGVYAATTRRNLDGAPEPGWNPQEKITREEALAAYTRNPAIVAGTQAGLGTLAPGKLADFVVLPGDPCRVADGELRDMRPRATFVSGQCVFQTPEVDFS